MEKCTTLAELPDSFLTSFLETSELLLLKLLKIPAWCREQAWKNSAWRVSWAKLGGPDGGLLR